jgi:hypothetical protein
MELYAFQTFSFQSLVHDVLTLVGLGAALLAGFAFISLGFLLPGLLTTLGGHHDSPRGEYLEFGPVGAPTISEPAPPRGTDAPALQPSPRPVRPQLRHRIWGGMALLPAPSEAIRSAAPSSRP